MTIDRRTAKALCTADEFKLYEAAQPKKLATLSAVQLRGLVSRSRTPRDKWRDLARGQRRSSQAAKGRRQTEQNARSDAKAQLFAETHQIFADKLKAVEQGQVKVPAGTKPLAVKRADRRIVTRAVRSVVKDQLDRTSRKINRSSSSRRSTKAAPGAKSIPVVETAVPAATAPAKKPAAKKKVVKKSSLPALTKARKKKLAELAQVPAPQPAGTPGGSKRRRTPAASAETKSITASRNRPAKAKASESRIARGGGTRVKGHVSAAGKRSQARRDSKGR